MQSVVKYLPPPPVQTVPISHCVAGTCVQLPKTGVGPHTVMVLGESRASQDPEVRVWDFTQGKVIHIPVQCRVTPVTLVAAYFSVVAPVPMPPTKDSVREELRAVDERA